MWQIPGGHLEHGESFFACAERETLEETGLKVRGVRVLDVTNDIFPEGKHYITIFVLCEMLEVAEPQVRPTGPYPFPCPSADSRLGPGGRQVRVVAHDVVGGAARRRQRRGRAVPAARPPFRAT